jgi:hypothetical protein
MKKAETIIAKVVMSLLFLALAIQLTYIIAGMTNHHHSITRLGKAALGITW